MSARPGRRPRPDARKETTHGHKLEGRLHEVCNCNVLCWIGENPDNSTCEASLAYHFDTGEIDGIDVSGLAVASAAFVPGNVLAADWKVCLYVSEEARDDQMQALTAAVSGRRAARSATSPA